MYRIFIRPFVRGMKPEKASRVALSYFRLIGKIPGGRLINRLVHRNRAYGLQREVFGLEFYNPLGLGAGLDRRGDLYNDLEDFGFSFVEIGPLDLDGTRHAIANLQKEPHDDILAACISKDIATCFSLAYDFCDMFVIDMSGGLDPAVLDQIMDIRLTYDEYKPVIIKVSEHIGQQELTVVLEYCMLNGVDGIQVRKAQDVVLVNEISSGRFPVMANCHIKSPVQAAELLEAGASLIEIQSALVAEGPGFVRKILSYLEKHFKNAQIAANEPS